jgi:hypothetical protein
MPATQWSNLKPIPVEIDPIGVTWESKIFFVFFNMGKNNVIDFRLRLHTLINAASPVNANNSNEPFKPIPVEIDPIGVTWESKIFFVFFNMGKCNVIYFR